MPQSLNRPKIGVVLSQFLKYQVSIPFWIIFPGVLVDAYLTMTGLPFGLLKLCSHFLSLVTFSQCRRKLSAKFSLRFEKFLFHIFLKIFQDKFNQSLLLWANLTYKFFKIWQPCFGIKG